MMGRFLFCDNERDHRRQAEDDFRRSPWPDREQERAAMYDSGGCGAVYMDRFDELRRERREQEDAEERRAATAARRSREERELEQYEHDDWPEQQYEPEQLELEADYWHAQHCEHFRQLARDWFRGVACLPF